MANELQDSLDKQETLPVEKGKRGRKKGSPNAKLLEMHGSYDWQADRWKVAIELSKKAVKLIDEFKVTPNDSLGEDYKSYNDGTDVRKRFLCRRALSTVGDMSGRSGIFFDKEKIEAEEREVFFDSEEKAKDFITEVKYLFSTMQEQTVKMKRQFTATLVVSEKEKGKPDDKGGAKEGLGALFG